jgi:hypothetical protein
MTTMTTPTAGTTITGRFRIGLAVSALLGLSNLVLFFLILPRYAGSGQDSPPTLVIVTTVVFGLVNIVCAIVAWRSGNRVAVRVNAAVLIINALLTLPAFFVSVDAGRKVGSSVIVLLTVTALLLTLRREPAPFTVTD